MTFSHTEVTTYYACTSVPDCTNVPVYQTVPVSSDLVAYNENVTRLHPIKFHCCSPVYLIPSEMLQLTLHQQLSEQKHSRFIRFCVKKILCLSPFQILALIMNL